MALGPLLAVPMSRVPTIHFGPFTFNAITAGAYVMSLIWLVFLAVTVFFFTEPPIRYYMVLQGSIELHPANASGHAQPDTSVPRAASGYRRFLL